MQSKNFDKHTSIMQMLWQKYSYARKDVDALLEKAKTYDQTKEALSQSEHLLHSLAYEFDRYIEREVEWRVAEKVKKYHTSN